ncbi:helix-turn-helix domain-containing protein [Psychroserpens sp. MEBiC05023]
MNFSSYVFLKKKNSIYVFVGNVLEKSRMNNNYKNSIFLLFFLLITFKFSFSQEDGFIIPDSLKEKSYNELLEASRKYLDTIKSNILYNTYLQKAKNENNICREIYAYTRLSYWAESEAKKLALLEKSIKIGKDSNRMDCTFLAYSFKAGHFLYIKNDYNKALDNYLALLEVSRKENNKYYTSVAKYSIAYIKNYIGYNKEALKLFKQSIDFKGAKNPKFQHSYILSLDQISKSYTLNQKLDSASITNLKGISLTKKSNTKYIKNLYPIFVFNEGVNLFHKKEYKKSKDSLNKAYKLYKKHNRLTNYKSILYYLYLGKLECLKKNPEDAFLYFSKMDSLNKKEQIVHPEIREGSEFLINYFKNKGQKDKQLLQINNLLKFDSIYNHRTLGLSSRINKEYDTPTLLKYKVKLINELKNENQTLNHWLLFSITTSVLIAGILYYQNRKKRFYKQKFNKLLEQQKSKPVENLNNDFKKTNNVDVPINIIKNILDQLKNFENENKYLKKNTTINSLAKELKTNSKYLSKTINFYKKKTFTKYINDLRIDYIIEELKENKKIRHYTIQSIAEEIGFNNAESFASAFKKNTGLNPSYFIKKLNEQEKF